MTLLLLMLSSLVAPGTFAQSSEDTTPSGMVAFFMTSGTTCMPGWSAFPQAYGRLLLAVTNPANVNVTQGTPMTDQTAPVHTHTFATTVTVTQKNLEAESGSNHSGAASNKQPSVPDNPPGTTNGGTGESSNLPFMQILACVKN
jgi:endonuclease/exonuclease/phosphatase (EEP) superfamily protein YafD